jgi:regulator of sigma E protease
MSVPAGDAGMGQGHDKAPAVSNSAGGSQPGDPLPVSEYPIARRALTWLIAGAIVYVLLVQVGISNLTGGAIAGIGLGFAIFIHELGHFAVAKWCDVHVEAFSIGFGPAVPGCSFRRGETMYKIAWFPLGGYVKMVGEGAESEEEEDDPRSFKNKSVWQRMAIISAGVIMNVIFGFVCFFFVFRTHGVEQQPAVVWMVDPGGAAWTAGLPAGAIISEIGTSRHPYFEDLQYEVSCSSAGQKLKIVYEAPSQSGVREIFVEPRREKDNLSPVIGVAGPREMRLLNRVVKSIPPVQVGSPAASAQPAFKAGDWIVGTTDPDDPQKITLLPTHNRDEEGPRPDYFAYRARMRRLIDKPVMMRVQREENGAKEFVDITVGPAYRYSLGLRMRMGQIAGVRDNSPASRARPVSGQGDSGIKARNQADNGVGDILDQVDVADDAGMKIRWMAAQRTNQPAEAGVVVKELDPARLPDELAAWAAKAKKARKVILTVLRQVGHAERQPVQLETEWDPSWSNDNEEPLYLGSPLAIPGLGLAYRIDAVVEGVEAGSPAAAEIKRGDLIKGIRFSLPTDKPGEFKPGKWADLDPDGWGIITRDLQELESKEIGLRLQRNQETIEVTLTARPDTNWPALERGVNLGPETCRQKADSLLQAASLGMKRTYRNVVQIYLHLHAMLTNRVSPKAMGGPILIAATAYYIANENIFKFILFLGMISINLAVVNFLPIPIMDGGHMVFLIYEKLRGAPPSETVRAAATYAGLAVVAALVVFVFWLDITRML